MVACKDVAGDERNDAHRQAGNIDTVDRTPIYTVPLGAVALAVIRVFAQPARAGDVAITDLKQPAFQLVNHKLL
jgi:hypothetical protein